MNVGNEIILVAGVLSVLAVFAGLASSRIGNPLSLALIATGVLAGRDGLGKIQFGNFPAAYVIGSVCLAMILFQGGLNTDRDMIRKALWPAATLATLGVLICTCIVGAAAILLFAMPPADAFLLGAVTAPTDAAAVSVMLRISGVTAPSRTTAALELESGGNDPMSVFLTVALVDLMTNPDSLTPAGALLLFVREMGGGAVIGLAGGYVLLRLFRWLSMERSAFPVLATGCALTIFGGAQVVGASGFLATYLAGAVLSICDHPVEQPVNRFFAAIGWLAQNTLFLILGLLVTPHELPPFLLPGFAISAVLVLLARPLATLLCLLPFRWTARESAFIAWAGLRGAVPIYLSIIPLLAGVKAGWPLFNVVFLVVIVSVAVQGWTVKPLARLLGLGDGRAASDQVPR